jgi:RNA polymerase sigma-70 factor (ECF subfamily)
MHAAILRLPAVLSVATDSLAAGRRIEPGESDGELVRRARRGDRWAEEALYHRHVRTVTRVALRLLARTTEAEDVIQDAFVIALGDLGKLREEEAFGAWLLRIVVHQVHRRFRRRRLTRALGLERGDDDVALADQADPRAGPEVCAELAEIDTVLRSLPARCRIAWILRRVEGYELREISSALDCSLATTKRLVQRAERAVQARVAVELGEDDDG